MAQLTVRKLDAEIVCRLKMRAVEHNRAILEATLASRAVDFWEGAARLRSETSGRGATDSAELRRAGRARGPWPMRPR